MGSNVEKDIVKLFGKHIVLQVLYDHALYVLSCEVCKVIELAMTHFVRL